ncbi:hypothetical protein [Paenibacillus pinistramenti]|uniref:hypothetical protein n=1 Tax=Paenibacillus pinistramenti TaxID=1768003 RepID=UPI0011090E8E|nr:hypothetical protein [Paenibacillus pinistramenti]
MEKIKGKFTLVLQEEEQRSIQADVKANPELKGIVGHSRREFKFGKAMSTSELLESLFLEDFR